MRLGRNYSMWMLPDQMRVVGEHDHAQKRGKT